MLRLNWLAIDCRPYSTHQYIFFLCCHLISVFCCFSLCWMCVKSRNYRRKEKPMHKLNVSCFHYGSPVLFSCAILITFNKQSFSETERIVKLFFVHFFFLTTVFLHPTTNQWTNERTKKNRKLFAENFNGMPNNKSSLHEFDTVRLFDSYVIYKWFAHEWEN